RFNDACTGEGGDGDPWEFQAKEEFRHSRPTVRTMHLVAEAGSSRGLRRRARVLHVHSAVDSPYLSGDVGGGVGGKEVNDTCDLFRPAQSPHRDLPLDPV